tara:strand:- start:1270 stop:2442 length:1173 start_codon:yes stop_codon:yes gene_type:complete
MKKRILRYLKHISLTFLCLVLVAIVFGLYIDASLSYDENPQRMNWHNDGPYLFSENDSIITLNYIKGSREEGYYVDRKKYSVSDKIPASSYFSLDSTSFDFTIETKFETPKAIYNDNNKIIAVSDIESSYKAFRDFLINTRVIDKNLKWIFEKGHLVLVGDFMDRGFSTTQVLWFIYKLEQEAKTHGGQVHFIIGNHELKNMHGDYLSASPKYKFIAAMLGKTQSNLYDKNSIIGKWLSSKNTIELINGMLFTHGGLHPDTANIDLSLNEVNQLIRTRYYLANYPKANETKTDFLTSSQKGICWYRGYFKDNLSQQDVEVGLNKFDAKAIVVGHTLQSKVKTFFNKKVIAIDVKHPKDYHKNWPTPKSEGLLIEGDSYFRILSNGEIEKL